MSTNSIKFRVIYGRKWAIDVVQRFIERYPRGCHIVAQEFNVSHKQLYMRLIRMCRWEQQCHWERAKWLIKNVDRGNVPSTTGQLSDFTLVLNKFWDDVYIDSNCDYKKTEKTLDSEYI